ncbi:hypothetical protein EBZ39_04090 [bacterium]|nr:hypothetical protein [bacterium]
MELVENVYVSDFTKKTLEQFGWKQGDAIPADLGQLMIRMKEGLPATTRDDVLVDRAVMTEEQVNQITTLLKEARELGRKKQKEAELEEQTKNMAPSVSEVYKQLSSDDGPQIIDDREEAAAEQSAVEDNKTDEQKPTEEPVIEPPPLQEIKNPPIVIAYCPRCGWDMRQKFEVVPTDRDKEDFIATLLGATRFKKRYELFGGRLVVTFRSLLAEENKLIYRQLVLDQQKNNVATETEWFVQMMDYRLACSLETIEDKKGKVIASIPLLEEMPEENNRDEPLATSLPKQLKLVNTHLAQEATRRLVGMHLRQFQRLVEALEAMALEPNFWTGIE